MAFPPPPSGFYQQASIAHYAPLELTSNHMYHPDVQALKQQLDNALKKIREHEATIVHQANQSRKFLSSLKTKHGIICPDCNHEIAHVCPSHPSIPSSSLQQPTPSSTLSNTVYFPPQFASQDNHIPAQPPFAAHGNLPYDLAVSFRPTTQPPPDDSAILPTFMSHFTQPYAPISVPPLAVASKSGNSSSFPLFSPPRSSRPINPQRNLSPSYLGKRNPTDLDCGSESKKAPWCGPQSSQSHATFSVYPPSLDVSSLPFSTDSVSRTLQSSSASKPVLMADYPSIEKQEIAPNWSITYNQKVQKAVDVRLVRALHVDQNFRVYCLKFSRDGKYLAVGFDRNGATTIYDVQTGKKSCTLRDIINGKNDSILDVSFSPDGLYLATYSTNSLIRVWDISKKHVRKVFRGSIWCTTGDIDFSPDSRHIAIRVGYYDQVRIYSMRDGSYKTLEGLEKEGIHCMYFSPDGRHIAVGTNAGNVLLLNVRAGKLVERLVGHQNPVLALAFSPDGAGLVSGGCDQTIRFWNISSLRVDRSGLRNNKTDAANNSGKEVWQRNHTDSVNCVSVSSNGRWVLSFSYNGVISIRDAHKPDLLCKLDGDICEVLDFVAEFSTVSDHIALAGGGELLLLEYKEI